MDERREMMEKCKRSYKENFETEPHPFVIKSLEHQKSHLLNLSGNSPDFIGERLGDQDTLVLYKILKDQYQFVSVNLGYNNITDEGSKHLAQLIKCSTVLLNINLMYNDIGGKGGELIATALRANNTLETLNINGNKIGRNGSLMFARCLQVNTCLKELQIGNTDMNVDSMIAIATVLSFSNCTLLRISLNRPLLKDTEEEIISGHISNLIRMNPVIIELHLQQFGMEDYGASIISESLGTNTSLTHLDLSRNRISEDGISRIATAFTNNHTIELLNIGYNRIGNAGAIYLSSLLDVNTSLKTLIIVYSKIGVTGLLKIVDAIHNTNRTLKTLFIWGNDLSPNTGEAIHNLLEINRLLPEDVDVHPYLVDGVYYLGEGFQKNLAYKSPGYGERIRPTQSITIDNQENRCKEEKTTFCLNTNEKRDQSTYSLDIDSDPSMEESNDHYIRDRVRFSEMNKLILD